MQCSQHMQKERAAELLREAQGGPYSRTGPWHQLPCTFLRVRGLQAIQYGRRKGRRQWKSERKSVFGYKNRRFWRAAPQVNEDFLATHVAMNSILDDRLANASTQSCSWGIPDGQHLSLSRPCVDV